MFENEMQTNIVVVVVVVVVVIVVVAFAFDQCSPFGPPSDRGVGYKKLIFFVGGGRGGGGICRGTV